MPSLAYRRWVAPSNRGPRPPAGLATGIDCTNRRFTHLVSAKRVPNWDLSLRGLHFSPVLEEDVGGGQMIRRVEIPAVDKRLEESTALPETDDAAGGVASDESVRGFRRVCYFGGAGFFFSLGLFGAILPGLPATPFLLLTSYCLLRCSPGLNARLLQSRFFGPILTDWQVHGGVRPHVKAKAVIVVIAAVAASILLTESTPGISVTIALVALIGILVIWRLPAARD